MGRRILTDRSSVVFVPPASGIGNGHLLFFRDTTLMAQPFDAGTLQLAGDAFPIAGQVSNISSPLQVAASASQSGILVYLANSIPDHQLVWFDRSGKEQSRVGSPGALTGISLSPDGQTVAFTRPPAGIWLHELTRSSATRFTFLPVQSRAPVWSPDGARIAFWHVERRPLSQGYERRRPGGASVAEQQLQEPVRLVWRWAVPALHGNRSKDPRRPVDSAGAIGQTRRQAGPICSDRFFQTEFIESQGQFSPDGRWIAYASDESGQPEVYISPFPSGVGKWRASSNGGRGPRWRKDGKECSTWNQTV
jgi:hypothetical protein